jgi:hypothetical protein
MRESESVPAGDGSGEWIVEQPPDTDEDGSIDMGGPGMIVRAPNGHRYEIIAPDICAVIDR